MQHCFHVVFYMIGDSMFAYYASWSEREVLQNLYLTVIFQIITKCDAHANNSKSLFIYILLFLDQSYSNKL